MSQPASDSPATETNVPSSCSQPRIGNARDFWIETASGERAFAVDGKAFPHGTFVLEDPAGEELYTIQMKGPGVREMMEMRRGGHPVATIKKTLVGINDHYSVAIESGDDLSATSNFLDNEFEFERAGERVAQVSNSWFRVRHTFGVEIAPHLIVRRLGDTIALMSDKIDHDGLYRLAEAQAGYFTAQQALATGMERTTLRHHARPRGRFERIRRGLYRLRHFPSAPHEHLVAAWLPLRDADAVVSHESALELYGLSDAIPRAVHLTLPRARRGQRPRAGVRFHTLEHPPEAAEVRELAGVPVTSPERTILDSLEAGTQPDQIELAMRQALDRGLTTPHRLRAAAAGRPTRVREFIDRALTE